MPVVLRVRGGILLARFATQLLKPYGNCKQA